MAAVASQTSQRPRQHGSKRKGAPTDGDEELTTAKKIASERPKERPAADLDIDESIGHMNPGLLADYISKKIKRAFRDLSTVELEDKYLPQWIFYDTSDFDLSRKLDNLPTFLEHFSDSAGNLSNSSEDLGSPHTLVIAASGLRAADVTRLKFWLLRCGLMLNVVIRSLRKFQSQESAVGKLFAKHIKLPEAVDYLKRTKYVRRTALVSLSDGP